MGYIPEAIKEYEIALQNETENLEALNNYAAACFQLGWYEKAGEICKLILSKNPDSDIN